MTVLLYDNPVSGNCYKVRLLLTLLGTDFERHELSVVDYSGRVETRLGSAAARAEGRQNMLCAYLSGALLFGLGANALLGWWWADPATALVIAAVAVREGRDSWRGESCCVPVIGDAACADGCCR
jgi:hypothetical protein